MKNYILGAIVLTSIFWSFHSPSIQTMDAHLSSEFDEWIARHGKVYSSASQKQYRLNKFISNYRYVTTHNARFHNGQQTYQVEMNLFADLDTIEFKSIYLGLKKSDTAVCSGSVQEVANPPASVDWTTKGAVTGVKNQGQCGSCWAFSTTGALQGLSKIEKGTLPLLSQQQLVDCAGGSYGNQGCNGGDMDAAMWYIIDNGITDQSKYPYKGKDQKCYYKPTMLAYSIKNCAEVPANSTKWLVNAVAAQPVSISVEADQIGFQLYKTGVFSGNCGTDLDHGITLVGYGTDSGRDYWKAKNSWGATWGNQGYILLAKGADGPGQCGILMENTVPLQSV